MVRFVNPMSAARFERPSIFLCSVIFTPPGSSVSALPAPPSKRPSRGQAVPGIVNAAKIARVIGVELDQVKEFEHAVAQAKAARLVVDNPDTDDSVGRRR